MEVVVELRHPADVQGWHRTIHPLVADEYENPDALKDRAAGSASTHAGYANPCVRAIAHPWCQRGGAWHEHGRGYRLSTDCLDTMAWYVGFSVLEAPCMKITGGKMAEDLHGLYVDYPTEYKSVADYATIGQAQAVCDQIKQALSRLHKVGIIFGARDLTEHILCRPGKWLSKASVRSMLACYAYVRKPADIDEGIVEDMGALARAVFSVFLANNRNDEAKARAELANHVLCKWVLGHWKE